MTILTMLMLGLLILMGTTVVVAFVVGIWFYRYYRRMDAAWNVADNTLEEITDAADATIKPPVKRKATRKEPP